MKTSLMGIDSELHRLADRAAELLVEHRQRLFRQTDRMFLSLMVLQWLAAIATALFATPRTWIGETSSLHAHVGAAIVLGGLISLAPIYMIRRYPGYVATRHTVAIAQGFWTALLIHLTGGRIETHFHAFGSLAFLACYRDWKILLSATLVFTLDHVVRGLW